MLEKILKLSGIFGIMSSFLGALSWLFGYVSIVNYYKALGVWVYSNELHVDPRLAIASGIGDLLFFLLIYLLLNGSFFVFLWDLFETCSLCSRIVTRIERQKKIVLVLLGAATSVALFHLYFSIAIDLHIDIFWKGLLLAPVWFFTFRFGFYLHKTSFSPPAMISEEETPEPKQRFSRVLPFFLITILFVMTSVAFLLAFLSKIQTDAITKAKNSPHYKVSLIVDAPLFGEDVQCEPQESTSNLLVCRDLYLIFANERGLFVRSVAKGNVLLYMVPRQHLYSVIINSIEEK